MGGSLDGPRGGTRGGPSAESASGSATASRDGAGVTGREWTAVGNVGVGPRPPGTVAVGPARVHRVPGDPGIPELLRIHRDEAELCALDSAAGWPRRHGILGIDPLAPLWTAPEAHPGPAIDGVARLARLDRGPGGDPIPGPFHGGFLGALGYDLGVHGEREAGARPEPWGWPPWVGALFPEFYVRDEGCGRTYWISTIDRPDTEEPHAARLERRRAEWARLADAGGESRPFEVLGELRRHVTPAEHARRIECIRGAIREGEIYQANLAHRFTQGVQGDPLDLYLALRAANPAPYMGYLKFAGPRPGAILSASPELLLELQDGSARTRPIKGTIARDQDPELDRAARKALLESTKDLAELTMIVDLERNDLGRVARPGGVRVEGFPRLQTYAHLHHLVGDVVADLPLGCAPERVLASLFPGGSITGAPKLRSMEWIARLEGEGRGFFTGSLGALDHRGHGLFNILIRTLMWRPRGDEGHGEIGFHVGGGITIDSEPKAEDDETLVKARGLVEALGRASVGTSSTVEPSAGSPGRPGTGGPGGKRP